ncbi:unnamed protein product, partial [Effrenium voratum]
APKAGQMLEQLAGLSQAVARAANSGGRLRLSFGAATCTLWCSMQLSEQLSRRWEEVNASEAMQDLAIEEQDWSLIVKRIRHLSSAGSALKRPLRSLPDYWDHRRRFIRCLAKPGGASEEDLRLLFLPRDAQPAELAAHLRRMSSESCARCTEPSGAVEELMVPSRKRSLQEASGHKPRSYDI